MVKLLISNIQSFLFNLSLLTVLLVGIQNSERRQKVFFFKFESIELPLSFILGTSFITGSITGGLLLNILKKNKSYEN